MASQPDTLAKYCTVDAAIKVLQSKTLRWSAPHLFSDPFELSHNTQLTFDPKSLLSNVIRAACGIIFAREEPRGISPLSAAIRRWRDEERFTSPEEAGDVLRELMSRVVDQKQDSLDEIMSAWRLYTRNLRICCFSTKPDNLTSWKEYADKHRGVVLKFHCADGSVLGTAEKVTYDPTPPEVTSLKEQIDAILHNQELAVEQGFQEKFLCKSPTCKSEREWRFFYSLEPEGNSLEPGDNVKRTGEDSWFDNRPFNEQILTAIYFGLHTPIDAKKLLINLVKEKYPHTKIYQAEMVQGKYDMKFSRVNIKHVKR